MNIHSGLFLSLYRQNLLECIERAFRNYLCEEELMYVNIIFLTTGLPFDILTGKLSQDTFKGLYYTMYSIHLGCFFFLIRLFLDYMVNNLDHAENLSLS